MTKEDIVLRLVEKVFSLEDKCADLQDVVESLHEGIKLKTEENEKLNKAAHGFREEYIRENKRRIEVEDRMVELEKELKRNEEAFAAFGIHKNDVGFWQDKNQTMD